VEWKKSPPAKSRTFRTGSIYNGTEKGIESVTVKVTVYEKEDNELFDRTFRLTSSSGKALSSAEYIADCGFTLNDGQSIKWYIVSANFK